MGYVTVTGGREAIDASLDLANAFRLRGAERSLPTNEVRGQLRLLVDRVMGEAGFYAQDYAALALKQCEGDALEAAFVLRAYRSTLERRYVALPIQLSHMRVIRRISSAFRNVPGGQLLGPTHDYRHRLLQFALLEETPEDIRRVLARLDEQAQSETSDGRLPKVSDILRAEGLLATPPASMGAQDIFDITREKVIFPASRSARLQTLARGETGAMVALAYSSMRGFGAVHPTIGELRVGYCEWYIEHPFGDGSVCMGELLLTEVETVNSFKHNPESDEIQFALGYGLCFGQNEVKGIAMAILEHSLDTGGDAPAEDEEFVLSHVDSIESAGFVSHLKLPHYVTFQSSLDRIRNARREDERRKDVLHDQELELPTV